MIASGGKQPWNKGRKLPPEVLTGSEVNALLGVCSKRAPTGIRNRALIAMLYRGQLRIGEALAFKPKDLDRKGGTLRVLHGKGDRARTVGLDSGAVDSDYQNGSPCCPVETDGAGSAFPSGARPIPTAGSPAWPRGTTRRPGEQRDFQLARRACKFSIVGFIPPTHPAVANPVPPAAGGWPPAAGPDSIRRSGLQ